MAKGDKQKKADQEAQYGIGSTAATKSGGDIFKGIQPTITPGKTGVGGMVPLTNTLQGDNAMFRNNYNTGVSKNLQSYDDIMGAYQNFLGGNNSSGNNADTGAAKSTFRDIMGNGGMTPQAEQDMRARAIAPTRSIYDRGMQEVNRNKALTGGYSPNANASLAKMAREQSYNISDINTNVNAGIAQQGTQNRLSAASGLGSLANQESELSDRMRLGAMGGMTDLYGTTPGLANMFGNQLGQSNNQIMANQGMTNDWLDTRKKKEGINWGQVAGVAASAAPYIAMAASDRNLKENIEPVNEKNVLGKLKKLDISKWNYKGDKTKHIGPMAQDFQSIFGVGDGKTIHLVDVMGVTTAATKALAKKGVI